MNRLLLLRHAKAAWAAPGTRDFDRPLDEIGRRQAAEMGDVVLARGLVPRHVLCSPARRARETWDILATRLTGDKPATDHDERLYAADATTYLDIVRAMTADGPLLVVGHNPMLEDVAHIFAARGSKEARAGLAGGFPPCAMAVIAIDGDFAETTPATSELAAFLTPGGR